MEIKMNLKKIFQKLYVYAVDGKPVPIYLDQPQETKDLKKVTIDKKKATKKTIFDYSKGEMAKVKEMDEFRESTIIWYEIDGVEIPLNYKTLMNKDLIDRAIKKIIKPSTMPKTKEFLLSLLKRFIWTEEFTPKEHFLLVIKSFGVSDFNMRKKKPREFGSEDIGFIEGKFKSDINEITGVKLVYGEKKGPCVFTTKDNILTWKAGKYWTVCDRESNKICRIEDKIMKDNFKPEKISNNYASTFVKTRNILESKGIIKKEEDKDKNKEK